MKPQLLVMARDEKIKNSISRYFSGQGFQPIVIEREKIIPEQQMVICEDRIMFGDRDLLKNTAAAIILDSGYMWPQPVLKPTQEVWERYRNNLDEYLRNERESFSLWYSLLEILNKSIPLCINPQEAFEAEAFKPWTFTKLAQAGIPVPPFISGNDQNKIKTFLEKNAGSILSLPLSENDAGEWIEDCDTQKLNPEQTPILLQSLSTKHEIKIIAVNGKPVSIHPPSSDISQVIEHIPTILNILHMPLAQLTFRYAEDLALSDFHASPDFSSLSMETIDALLKALAHLIGDQK
jgi:hypothetical protein